MVRNFGEVRLKVTGASMIPAIWPGDVITVHSCDMGDLQPGEIVLYRREGTLVAHRIAWIRGDLLSTRGDALQHDDLPIGESEIVGKVCLVRNGRCINPSQSSWQRAGSSILRRSDFCMRMTLRLGRRLRRHGDRVIS